MSNRRLFWRIVENIEKSIDSGVYPMGSRLPPERELAQSFDVSRPTIREAIIALEVRGRIEVKTGSGVYVLTPAEISEPTANINAFEITQARALIEGEVAAIAATSITESELKQLHKTVLDMKDEKNMAIADEEFHLIIARSTRNAAMILSVTNLWALRSSSIEIIEDYNSVCRSDNSKTIAEHNAIYEALAAGNAAEARTTMHNHFNRLINTLFDAAESKALEETKRINSAKRDLYSIPAFNNS